MRRAAAVGGQVASMLVFLLLVTGCVSPSRTDRDYELKAGNTAASLVSLLRTAVLGAEAAADDRAPGPFLSVLLGNTEKDALSVQGTFDSVQPPSGRADRLRSQLDELMGDAVDGLSRLRILVRRGQLHALTPVARGLKATIDGLEHVAETYP